MGISAAPYKGPSFEYSTDEASSVKAPAESNPEDDDLKPPEGGYVVSLAGKKRARSALERPTCVL